jgi:putative transposase
LSDRDRSIFLDKLTKSIGIYQVQVHAYVLMSNHFHLILESPKGNLSEFMRHFNISYTAAYNRRHHRVGHLYQGRFKSILIDPDNYLLELSRYVHLNPVRLASGKGIQANERIRNVERYPWSSLGGYVSSRQKQFWLTYEKVLAFVGGSRKKYWEFVVDGIRRGYDTPWDGVKRQAVLGKEDFVERVKSRTRARGSRREQPAVREFEATDPARILRAVARYCKVAEGKLTDKRTGYRDERAIGLELMHRHSAASQARSGRFVGLDYTAVSRERKRLRKRMEIRHALRKTFQQIEVSLCSNS